MAAAMSQFVRSSATYVGRNVVRSWTRHVGPRVATVSNDETRAMVRRLLPTLVLGAGGQTIVNEDRPDNFDIAQEPLVARQVDVLPKSIEMLVTNDIAVPPRRLLEDLPWDELAGMQDPVVREEIARTRAQLEKFERKKLRLDPGTARDILSKFGSWMCMRDIEITLDTTPEGRAAIDEALNEMDSSVGALEGKRDRVAALLHNGKFTEAHQLAERALLASDRLKELLQHILESVQKTREEERERMFTFLKMSGACAVVGVGCYYLGVAPNGSVFSMEVFQALTAFSAIGSVVCLGFSAMAWFTSQECIEHYRKVRRAQTERYKICRRLQDAVDECLFGTIGMDVDHTPVLAASLPLPAPQEQEQPQPQDDDDDDELDQSAHRLGDSDEEPELAGMDVLVLA